MSALSPRRQGRLPRSVRDSREVTLIDLLDRLLQGGIVIQGEIRLAAADIDLVALDLNILIASIDKLAPR